MSVIDEIPLPTITFLLDRLKLGIYQCILLIDFNENKVLYVSQGMGNLFGITREKLLRLSVNEFYSQFYNISEMSELNMIRSSIREIISKNAIKNFTLSFNINIKSNNSNIHLVNHQLTPLDICENGKMKQAFVILSLPTTDKALTDIKVTDNNKNETYYYENNIFWKKKQKQCYSERELQILELLVVGKKRYQIADALNVSDETIKTYNAKLLKRIGTKNMIATIANAIHEQLF